MSSRWYRRPEGCVHGSTAPSARLSVRSGTTSASSYLRTLPNPLHSGHAPSGWLNENRRGCGRSRTAPHPLQRKSSPNSRVPAPTTSTASRPPPSRSAASTDSVMRPRCAESSTTRSRITAIAFRSPKSIGAGEAERDHRARPGVLLEQRIDDGLWRVRRGRRAAARTVDVADLRVEQPEVVVDLGGGADRRARRPDRVLLLQGHRRADLLDLVHVGTVDPLEEHPGVGREGLDVTPLALGEERVESERGLTGAGHPGHDGEAVVGDLERDVLEVVLSGAWMR